MKRNYTVEFICHFELVRFPFDRQVCNISFESTEASILLRRGRINSRTVALNEYMVEWGDWTEEEQESSSSSRIVVTFRLRRRITTVVLTTYIPTVLICLLCHSTVYYGGHLFKAVVAVNLTSLLCLVTMFNSVSRSLVRTSYVKMIDMWYFGTLCVPFVEVIVATAVEYLRAHIKNNNSWNSGKRIDNRVGNKESEGEEEVDLSDVIAQSGNGGAVEQPINLIVISPPAEALQNGGGGGGGNNNGSARAEFYKA